MCKFNKRDHEKLCMQIALQQIDALKGYQIDRSRTLEGREEERPDFLLIKDNHRIGVEHFLVDTLLEPQPKHNEIQWNSSSRQLPHQVEKVYNKYADGKIKGRENEAVQDIQNLLNTTLDQQTTFSFCNFIAEFYRVTSKHVQNIDQYKNENDIDKLGFICEIDIANSTYLWDVLQNGKSHKQRISPIPLTHSMWCLIELLINSCIDFFILVTIPNMQSSPGNNAKAIYYSKEFIPTSLYDAFCYPFRNRECELTV